MTQDLKMGEFRQYSFTIDEMNFYLNHIGLVGQKAYDNGLGATFNIELIEYNPYKWAYHVERKDKLVSDSRISGTYYMDRDYCFGEALRSIERYKFRTK